MQPLFEHRVRVDGYHTRALELEGDGPPLVLLHGYGDSADTWRPLLDLLGRDGRRAIAIDLPGFGRADALGPGAILPQLDAAVAGLVQASAAESGERVIVVGNSLGGVAALRAAERADLPIAGIVPIAPAGLEMPRWFHIIDRDPIVRTLLTLPVPMSRRVLAEVVGRVFGALAFAHPSRLEREVARNFASHYPDRSAIARLLETGRRLLPELESPFRLDHVRCPVLLVWGDHDRMVSHSGAQVVLQALPDSRFEILPGAGHCPQIEEVARVRELLAEFAGGLAAAV